MWHTFYFDSLLSGVYADLLLILCLVLKLDGAVDQSKESVVLTHAYVITGANGCASLSYYDIAGYNALSVSFLHTKTLRLTVAAVLSGANTLFMSEELQTDSEHRYILHNFLK